MRPRLRTRCIERQVLTSEADYCPANGKDYRRESLLDRKQELRRLLNECGSDARLQYVDYVDGAGIPLFEQVCRLDLEGIVAKQKFAPYVADREQSTWFKIRSTRRLPRCSTPVPHRMASPISSWST